MADGFDLARGLMQLSSQVEQRKARKEQKEFQERYEGPLKEAYTSYYNAMVDKMQDEELLGYEKDLKRAQVKGVKTDVAMSQATFDEIKMLRAGSDEDKNLARNYLLKIDQSDAFRDQLAAIRVRNEQLQTMISAQGQALGMQKFQLDKSETILSLLFSPQGTDLLERVYGKGGVGAVEAGVTERVTGVKAPSKDKKKSSFWSPKLSPISPLRTGPMLGKAIQAPKKKEAPVKSTPAEEPIAMNELVPAISKARENDIEWKDVSDGVERLKVIFPDLDKATELQAYDLLAEGVSVEEIEKFLREKAGLND